MRRPGLYIPCLLVAMEASQKADELSVPDPSPSEPVKAVMEFRPGSVSAGAEGELVVSIRIARAHYLHAKADPGGKFTPLGIEVELPSGIAGTRDWQFPPPETGRTGAPVYRERVLLRRPLRVKSSAAARSLVITGKLRYQACTEDLCWPPRTLELSAPVSIQPMSR